MNGYWGKRTAGQSLLMFLTLVLLTAPLFACGLLTSPTPPTSAMTATPQLLPTATVPETVTSRSTTYYNESLGLSFEYPASWTIDESEGLITLASEPALLSADRFAVDGAGVLVATGAFADLGGDTLEEALLTAIDNLDFTDQDEVVDGPRATTIRGQQAATATVQGTDATGADPLVIHVSLIRSGDRVVMAATVTLAQNEARYGAVLDNIVGSIILSEAVTAPMAPAGSLSYGDTVQGRVPQGGSESWTFSGEVGDSIDIRVTPLDDLFDVTVDVLGPSGDSLPEDAPVDEALRTEVIRGLVLPANGEYTVVLRGFARASGRYELTVAEAGFAGTVRTIAAGDTFSGTLQTEGQDDYVVRAVDDTPLSVVVQPEPDFDVVIELLDDEGRVLDQEDSTYGREQLSFRPDANRVYTIRVRGFMGAGGTYTVALGAGDVFDGTGTTLARSGMLEEGNEEGNDILFAAPQGAAVRAVVAPEGEFDVVLEVWDVRSGQLLDSIDQSYGREETVFTPPTDGEFAFRVVGFEGMGGTYEITVDGPPPVIFALVPGDSVDATLGPQAFIDYSMQLGPGASVRAVVSSRNNMDATIAILDSSRNPLVEADDGFTGETEQLDFAAQGSGGTYYLRVMDFFGEPGGEFTLSLSTAE